MDEFYGPKLVNMGGGNFVPEIRSKEVFDCVSSRRPTILKKRKLVGKETLIVKWKNRGAGNV